MEKVYRVKDLSQLDEVAKDVLSVFRQAECLHWKGRWVQVKQPLQNLFVRLWIAKTMFALLHLPL